MGFRRALFLALAIFTVIIIGAMGENTFEQYEGFKITDDNSIIENYQVGPEDCEVTKFMLGTVTLLICIMVFRNFATCKLSARGTKLTPSPVTTAIFWPTLNTRRWTRTSSYSSYNDLILKYE